jgi:ribosomal protein L22
MSCREKRSFNQPAYSPKKAREVFDNIYEKKLAHSIKINKDGILEDVLVEE